MMRRLTAGKLVLAASAAAAMFVYPAGASAATLGETFAPNLCEGDTVYLGGPPGSNYQVPSPGVITNWSYQAAANAPAQIRFKVGRPAGGDDFEIVGESVLETITPNSLNSFGTQVPVSSGDLIGMYISELGGCARPGDPGDFRFAPANGDIPVGTTETFEEQAFQLDVAANLVTRKCKGRAPTMAGTPGNDTLRGTFGKDVIVGLGGKDTIKGRGGKDRICGNKGKDTLKGGGGKDTLKGAKGKDTLNGGRGRDKCIGGPGDDTARKCEVERSI